MEKANIVEYGLKNVHVHELTKTEDAYTWGKGTPFPGAKSISLSPEGETTPHRYDNMDYFIATSNNGYTADLEVALLPDWFLEKYLGYKKDQNGNLVETASANASKEFALSFQFEGDVKATRHTYYRVKASRPEISGETVDGSIEPQNSTLPLIISPIVVNDEPIVKVKSTSNTTDESYKNWFDILTAPEFTKPTNE